MNNKDKQTQKNYDQNKQQQLRIIQTLSNSSIKNIKQTILNLRVQLKESMTNEDKDKNKLDQNINQEIRKIQTQRFIRKIKQWKNDNKHKKLKDIMKQEIIKRERQIDLNKLLQIQQRKWEYYSNDKPINMFSSIKLKISQEDQNKIIKRSNNQLTTKDKKKHFKFQSNSGKISKTESLESLKMKAKNKLFKKTAQH